MIRPATVAAIIAIGWATPVIASESITSEPDGSSYHYVSHYSIEVNAPAATVWAQLIDLRSWMYEFDMSLESGTPGQEGEVRRLYPGQDFFVEVIKVVPSDLLVLANLPATFNGEYSTGVAVISLTESDGITEIKLTMSRRYSWDSAEPNPQRAMRESSEFQERNRAMWEDRFLERLRLLVESSPQNSRGAPDE